MITYIEEKYRATAQKESIYSFVNDALNIIVRDENAKYKHIDFRIKEVKKMISNIEAEIEYFDKLSDDRQKQKSWKMNFGKSLLVGFLFGIIGSSIYEVFRNKNVDVEKYKKDLQKSLTKSKETLKMLEEKKKNIKIKESYINSVNTTESIHEYSAATKSNEKMRMWFKDTLDKITRGDCKVKHIEKRIYKVKQIVSDLEAELDRYNKMTEKEKDRKEFNNKMYKSFMSGLMAAAASLVGAQTTVVVIDSTRYEDELKYYLAESKKALKYLEEEQKKLPIKEAVINKTNKELIEIENIFHNIIVKDKADMDDLNSLKTCLNKFLPEVGCSQVLYTDNRNNLFFGMCVYPNIGNDRLKSVYNSKSKLNNDSIYSYVLELDSKLFDINMNLTTQELTAILLHEIGHIILNKKSLDEINQMSQMIQADNPDYNFLDKFHRCEDFFRYAFYLTLRRMNSIFEKNQEEYIADGIVVDYGYGAELSSAFKKIIKNRKAFVQDTNNKGIAILWAFKMSTSMEARRVSLQYQINEIEKASGSKTEQNVLKKLRQIARNKGFVDESYKLDGEMLLELNILKNMKKKGLYSLEDDLYEYNIRMKNLDSEIEALDLIRNINYKINILKEYISTNSNDHDIERWKELLEKYLYLREQLMKTTIYRDKYYGLFVEIPKVNGRYQL